MNLFNKVVFGLFGISSILQRRLWLISTNAVKFGQFLPVATGRFMTMNMAEWSSVMRQGKSLTTTTQKS